MPRLFVFGLGYSALALARIVQAEGWEVAGTCRTSAGAAFLRQQGVESFLFDGSRPLEPFPVGAAPSPPPGPSGRPPPSRGRHSHEALPLDEGGLGGGDVSALRTEHAPGSEPLAGTTHLLASIPPDADDPALRHHAADIAALPDLAWVGYLSTTSVYGVTDGSRVDEASPCAPTSARGQRRLAAEQAWQALPLPAQVFRLSGIYGPGRSVFDTIRAGKAQRIVKPGQAFNRIHVADIAATLRASIARPNPGRVYNLADDLPAPSADLVTYACRLMGLAPPPEIPFEQAALSPMALEFWADNKRVANERIKRELGVQLAYPTWREGLDDIWPVT